MIIDTNIYSALDKGNPIAIEALRGQKSIYLSVISVGELRYGFKNGNKQKENEFRLNKFLAQDGVNILFPTLKTTEIYGQLAIYCRQTGHALSNNDLWIAALAKEEGLTLATFDKDFSVFEDLMGDKLIIL